MGISREGEGMIGVLLGKVAHLWASKKEKSKIYVE